MLARSPRISYLDSKAIGEMRSMTTDDPSFAVLYVQSYSTRRRHRRHPQRSTSKVAKAAHSEAFHDGGLLASADDFPTGLITLSEIAVIFSGCLKYFLFSLHIMLFTDMHMHNSFNNVPVFWRKPWQRTQLFEVGPPFLRADDDFS